MGHHESGLVLHVQIAAQLQGTDTLRAVRENGDSCQNVPDRKLAAGEDGAGRNRELAAAFLGLAAPHSAIGKGIQVGSATLGAEGFPVIVRKTDRLEGAIGVRIRHAENLREADRAGFGRKEEMLGHLYYIRYFCNRYSTLT
jgi:hypothetical protein